MYLRPCTGLALNLQACADQFSALMHPLQTHALVIRYFSLVEAHTVIGNSQLQDTMLFY